MHMSLACRRGTPPEYYWRCVSHLLANFFFWVSRVTTPEVLTPCSFLFISKVTSVQAGHVTAAWKPEAESPLVCYPNRKTMVNNELPSFKRTNQERPYKQLLHYWSRHLRVVLEQFRFTSLFNQHLGVLVSAPEPHLHPKLPWVLPRTPPQDWYTVKPVFHGTHIRGRGWLKARERALLGLLDDFKRQLKLSKVKHTSQDLRLIFHSFCHATSVNFYATNDAKPWRIS